MLRELRAQQEQLPRPRLPGRQQWRRRRAAPEDGRERSGRHAAKWWLHRLHGEEPRAAALGQLWQHGGLLLSTGRQQGAPCPSQNKPAPMVRPTTAWAIHIGPLRPREGAGQALPEDQTRGASGRRVRPLRAPVDLRHVKLAMVLPGGVCPASPPEPACRHPARHSQARRFHPPHHRPSGTAPTSQSWPGVGCPRRLRRRLRARRRL